MKESAKERKGKGKGEVAKNSFLQCSDETQLNFCFVLFCFVLFCFVLFCFVFSSVNEV
jgi:hypothetical protein